MRQRYFTRLVLEEAEAIAHAPQVWDRPQVPGLTIDGIESKDLDDAIWIQEIDEGVVLSIHIADVAEAVRRNSRVDRVAMARTQTRYLRRGNDPMLPAVLSENHLSLLEGQPRLTLTTHITLSASAHIQSVQIFESWISSVKRFSYPEVDQSLQDPSSPFYRFFQTCLAWADRLYQRRTDPEQLSNPEIPEGYWLDENGNWVLTEGSRYHAYLIIQEFMIVANTAIAQWLADRNVPALYRNHLPSTDAFDPPDLFQQLIQSGWEGELHRQLQCGLNRAEYALEPIGHFALKLPAYCHFTSPIRRFADLINHRIVKACLRNAPHPYPIETLDRICTHIEDVTQTQETETKEFFKARQQDLYERWLKTPAEIASLDPSDFSLLLRYASTTDQLAPLESTLRDRFLTQALSVEDWFVLLFLSDQRAFKHQVLQQLETQIHHAASIIAIAQNQLEEWQHIHYQDETTASPFSVWLDVTLDGETLTTLAPGQHSRKQRARHAACLAWITAYVENQLVPTEQRPLPSPHALPSSSEQPVLPPLKLSANPISQLNELCQQVRWDSPSYHFYTDETGEFLCECEVETAEETILGFGSGSRKNSAKVAAAQQALDQIYHPSPAPLQSPLREIPSPPKGIERQNQQ